MIDLIIISFRLWVINNQSCLDLPNKKVLKTRIFYEKVLSL